MSVSERDVVRSAEIAALDELVRVKGAAMIENVKLPQVRHGFKFLNELRRDVHARVRRALDFEIGFSLPPFDPPVGNQLSRRQLADVDRVLSFATLVAGPEIELVVGPARAKIKHERIVNDVGARVLGV